MQSGPRTVYRLLKKAYGPRNWWPVVRGGRCLYLPEFLDRPRTAPEILEIMVGALLTQNTAWDNVVLALIELKKRRLMSVGALEKIPESRLARLIRSSGYYNQKAKKIKALVSFIRSSLAGRVVRLGGRGLDRARQSLLSVWGIGPETADSILLYGYGFPVFVVDAYTHRVFSRIGSVPPKAQYDDIQLFFHKNLKRNTGVFREYHALIVELGKSVCIRTPKCLICPIRKICRFRGSQKSYAPERTMRRTENRQRRSSIR